MACNIKKIRNAALFSLAMFAMLSAYGQIKKVSYQLKFNKETSNFDCYMHVKQGSAFTKKERIQFNAQVSFVIPEASELSVVETYMPVQDNQNFRGNRPAKWYVSNKIEKPQALPRSRVISVVPEMSPTGLYNELREGDEVKLFSVKINPLPVCAEGIRIYDNHTDPNSDSPGMKGGDFSNGFTIGGTSQKYSDNLPMVNDMVPSGLLPADKQVFENENVVLEAGIWKNASTFLWTGPNGFRSTQQNPLISAVSAKRSGNYTLAVTSEEGCVTKQTMRLDVTSPAVLEKAESIAGGNQTFNASNSLNNQSAKVFPNPASSFINLAVSGNRGSKVVAHIYGMDGKIVMSNVINQTLESQTMEKTIPLKLQAGLYAIRLNIGGEESELRFICVE